MTERDSAWPPGTPCWVDLMTNDLAAAREFYAQLFGWQLTAGGPETGGYLMADIGGRPVAGLGQMEGAFSPAWTTYLASADAAATGEKITAAGGAVVQPAFDVMEFGRMLVGSDPTGGVFGVWQAGEHTGAQLVNVANTQTWNELLTTDYARAKDFYAEVFGYTYTDIGDGGFNYSTAEVGGQTVGGIGDLPPGAPAGVPSHWRVYFGVDDADAAVSEVARLGGTVLRPPADMPYGRWADVADPNGSSFSVIKPG
jgi:hypothetical protein